MCGVLHYHNAFVFILQEKSGVPLVAHKKFAEPKEVEVLFNADGVDLLATSYTTIRSPCSSLIDLICELLFQKLVITPIKKELGLAFKGSQKMVVEALEVIRGVTVLVFSTVALCK